MERAEGGLYWSSYYGSVGGPPPILSQFAAFIMSEIVHVGSIRRVLELGCGNGRDAIGFANYGFRVLGVDSSKEAIEAARLNAKAIATSELSFAVSDLAEKKYLHHLDGMWTSSDCLIYSRFFLHSIDSSSRRRLLEALSSLQESGGYLAAEFRIRGDEARPKVTEEHFRDFISPEELLSLLGELGYEICYWNQGVGLAKYGEDDALVGRVIARKSSF